MSATKKIDCYQENNGVLELLTEYIYTKNETIELQRKLRKRVDEIISATNGGLVKKLATIHDYLIDNVTYKLSDNTECKTVIGALIRGQGVCIAISSAFKLLCDELEIPSLIISGIAINSPRSKIENQKPGAKDNHCWNIIRDVLRKENYHIDVTWDGGLKRITRRFYFLISDELISLDHGFEPEKYPKCRENRSYNGDVLLVDNKHELKRIIEESKPRLIRFSRKTAPKNIEELKKLIVDCSKNIKQGSIEFKYIKEIGLAFIYFRLL